MLLILVKVVLLPKMLTFYKKNNGDIIKIKWVLVLKDIFAETAYVCVLTYQFKVSNKF